MMIHTASLSFRKMTMTMISLSLSTRNTGLYHLIRKFLRPTLQRHKRRRRTTSSLPVLPQHIRANDFICKCRPNRPGTRQVERDALLQRITLQTIWRCQRRLSTSPPRRMMSFIHYRRLQSLLIASLNPRDRTQREILGDKALDDGLGRPVQRAVSILIHKSGLSNTTIKITSLPILPCIRNFDRIPLDDQAQFLMSRDTYRIFE